MPTDIKSPRGYKPVGYEALGHGNANMTPPDLKEYYHLGRESWPDEPYYTCAEGQRYFIKNVWPRRPAGFADAAQRYYAAMERLVGDLMRVTALGLGLDEHFFDDKIDKHITAMRLNFYPEVKEPPKPGQLRGGEHTDYGLLTILMQDRIGGLAVKSKSGWIEAPPIEGSFVCNIGDMLDRMTGGVYRSTPHRVRDRSVRGRLSFPFFFDPGWNAVIEPIPTGAAVRDDRDERWDRASVHDFAGTYGDYVLRKVGKVFPELSADTRHQEAPNIG
jgi:isopenicillin N synthase-like dioxygenase